MDKKALSESDICDKYIRPAMRYRLCAGLRQRLTTAQSTQFLLAQALVGRSIETMK